MAVASARCTSGMIGTTLAARPLCIRLACPQRLARLRELRSPELHAASLEGPEDAQDRSGSSVPTASSVEQARGTDKTGCMTSVRGRSVG